MPTGLLAQKPPNSATISPSKKFSYKPPLSFDPGSSLYLATNAVKLSLLITFNKLSAVFCFAAIILGSFDPLVAISRCLALSLDGVKPITLETNILSSIEYGPTSWPMEASLKMVS